MTMIAMAFSVALAAAGPPQERTWCSLAEETSLDQSVASFEDGSGGWRRWGEQGCPEAAADLIAAYRQKHADGLNRGDRVLLTFHEAQLRANQGDAPAAVRLLASMDGDAASPATELYYAASRAFLDGDLAALRARRETLARLPEPPAFAQARSAFVARYGGQGLLWPLNLDVVDGLIACWGQPYSIAYSCRAKP